MIHCFRACGSACSGCGRACNEAGKACNAACSGCCDVCGHSCQACDDALGNCCHTICSPFVKVLERPLGSYVVLTAMINVPAAACAIAGLVSKEVQGCEVRPLTSLCAVDACLAILHICFAVYLQSRLFYGLQDREIAMATRKSSAAPQANARASELMNYAGHLVLYDVGFCLYIFVFVFSIAFNCFSFSWIPMCNVGSPLPWICASLLVLFFIMATHFSCLWVCALSCQACCQSTSSSGGGLMRFLLGKKAAGTAGTAGSAGSAETHHMSAQANVLGVPVRDEAGAPPMQAMPTPSAPPQAAGVWLGRR